jgi:hypothetical protein
MFTWVAPATANVLRTPWTRFPSHYQNAEVWVDAKTHDGLSQILIQPLSSMNMEGDTDLVGGGIAINSPGVRIVDVSSKLGPWIRLEIQSGGGVSRAVLGVWVVPKRG